MINQIRVVGWTKRKAQRDEVREHKFLKKSKKGVKNINAKQEQ